MLASEAKRRILIFSTGQSQLGTAIADHLSDAGQDIVLVLATTDDRSESEKSEILRVDENADDPEAEADRIVAQAGNIDTVIVANLVQGEASVVERLSTEAWNEALRRNASWAFLIARAAVPKLRQAEAPRIVFVIPEQVRVMPDAGHAAYLVSKAAIVGLTRTFALELGPEGITVNAIACDTSPDIASSWRVTRTTPPGADDVAATILFLLSTASNFITGSTLDVNGGRHMA